MVNEIMKQFEMVKSNFDGMIQLIRDFFWGMHIRGRKTISDKLFSEWIEIETVSTDNEINLCQKCPDFTRITIHICILMTTQNKCKIKCHPTNWQNDIPHTTTN